MKKIFSIFGWAALMAAAFTACSESDDVTTPTPEPQTTTYTVVASLDEDSRVTMGDSGMAWEAGDVIAVRQVLAGAEGSQENSTLAAENIAGDGTASYTFNSLNPGASAWFIYGWNAGSPANKVEFQYPMAQTQAAAGVMNKSYLRLMSDALEVPAEGQTTVETKMNIVGTVMRFIVYSGTGARATEKVQAVTLESVDNAISGNGAVVGKNLLQGGLYLQSNNVEDLGEECKIFWASDSKKTTVTLDEPLLLDKTDAASSEGNGIYLTVPAVSVGGYKYIVTTDKAVYTFDASTKAITFAENEVKSVLLNVEKATSRLDLASAKKYVCYEGIVGQNVSRTLGATHGYTNSIGYTIARYSDDNGESWVTSTEGKGVHEWLYNMVCTYTDGNGNEVAAEDSWLKVAFSKDNICHWSITTEENSTATDRVMVAKVILAAPEGYETVVSMADLTPKSYEYTLTVTQQAADAKPKLTFAGSLVGEKNFTSAAYSNVELGYWLAYLNGIELRNGYVDYPQLKCISRADYDLGNFNAAAPDWLSANLKQDGAGNTTDCVWVASVTENTTGAARQGVILQIWDTDIYDCDQPMRVVFVNQEAAVAEEPGTGGGETVWGYTIDWNNWKEGNVTTQEFAPTMAATYRFLWVSNVTKNGVAVTGEMSDADYAEFRSQVLRVKDGANADDFILVKIGPDAARYYFDCGTNNTTGAQLRTTWQIMNADGTVYHELDIVANP